MHLFKKEFYVKNLLSILFLIPTIVFGGEVDLKKSTFKWTGTKVSGSHYGMVSLKSAKMDEKEGHIMSGEFVMDMNSMTCSDLQGEWMDKLIGHLKNDDFFAVDKHPTATLKIKHAMMGKLEGTLTIKGISQPINLEYKKAGNNYTGTMKFDRTKFGIKYGSGNFFKGLGDKMIHDEVTVEFNVATK